MNMTALIRTTVVLGIMAFLVACESEEQRAERLAEEMDQHVTDTCSLMEAIGGDFDEQYEEGLDEAQELEPINEQRFRSLIKAECPALEGQLDGQTPSDDIYDGGAEDACGAIASITLLASSDQAEFQRSLVRAAEDVDSGAKRTNNTSIERAGTRFFEAVMDSDASAATSAQEDLLDACRAAAEQ